MSAAEALEDSRCVKPTLLRSLSTPHGRPATPYDAALAKVFSLVRTMWQRERQLVEELGRLEEQLELKLAELKRGRRAVKRRERLVMKETRELEGKKRSLETYKHILAAPMNRKPQTVLEGSEEDLEKDQDGDY